MNNVFRTRNNQQLVWGLTAALLTQIPAPAEAQNSAPTAPPVAASAHTPELDGGSVQSASLADQIRIPVGRSVVLTATAPLRRIYVANPAVLQSYTSGQREIVLTAKSAGVSSLLTWDTQGGRHMYSITADLDLSALQDSIAAALPGTSIKVDSDGAKVILSGTVPTDAANDTAFKLASLYSKDVVDSLRVVTQHGKQVELKVRIVEVDRTRLQSLGINFFTSGPNNYASTSTQQFATTALSQATSTVTSAGADLASPLNLLFYNRATGAGVNIQALENMQILQVLSEPTLTTMSGQAAKFLSGGEFPVPIVQGGTGNSTAISIVYRPYGVKVDFTPTVAADDSIHLKVAPEVSTLDYTNSVTISGFTIPALATRRAETEIEIRNGQSFVISGLLDHRVTDTLDKVPVLGDLPAIGDLFRSKSIQRSVVELAVLVTATVVDPINHPLLPVEPALASPNLDPKEFDKDLQKKWKIGPVPGANQQSPASTVTAPPPATPTEVSHP